MRSWRTLLPVPAALALCQPGVLARPSIEHQLKRFGATPAGTLRAAQAKFEFTETNSCPSMDRSDDACLIV